MIPLNEIIAGRWSPRAFSSRSITPEKLETLFQAARWASSSFNEQPWRFIYALREDEKEFKQLLNCLTDNNKTWAKDAPLLLLSMASKYFSKNGKQNRHYMHDVGLAMGNLLIQASSMGIFAHQMAGFYPEKAAKTFGIPKNFEPVAMVAIGYLGSSLSAS